MLLNWWKANNAVCTPKPIHRPYTQTFTPPEKQTPLLGIEPAAPPPSWAPSQDVIPLRQSTTPRHFVTLPEHCQMYPLRFDRMNGAKHLVFMIRTVFKIVMKFMSSSDCPNQNPMPTLLKMRCLTNTLGSFTIVVKRSSILLTTIVKLPRVLIKHLIFNCEQH